MIQTAEELHRVVRQIVMAAETPEDNARTVADLLVGAHLAGHDSHGVQHLPRYIRELKAGDIVPAARPHIEWETESAALVRGHWGWGHVTADFATRVGIEKARKSSIALIAAVEVNHIGRLGEYAERAAAQGVITLLTAGFGYLPSPTAVPHGGSKALFAPNPIAMGFPANGVAPVILDFATTQIAGGKVALARAKGQSLPQGCIIDKDGNPSTNPEAFFNGGALLPFGGHKGFGLMVATEILGRILPAADAYSDTPHGGVHFRHAGISLIAIDSGAFSSKTEFSGRTRELVDRIHAVPPAPGFKKVLAPGDFEQRSRAARSGTGIDIPESTWNELVATAQALGVPL